MSRWVPRSARRGATTLAAAAAAVIAHPAAAVAHGVQGRAETPVPLFVFFYTAAVVVVVSFVALGFAWSRPRLTAVPWVRAPRWLDRVILARPLLGVLRAGLLAGLLFVTAAAAFGSTVLNRNIAPVTIFVVWWVGLVPVTLLLGNAWRELNPWATIARALGARADTGRYPPAAGLWPACS